jgi:hypothetical protein
MKQNALAVTNGRGGQFTGTGELTTMQRAFVRFVVRNGGNAKGAARQAGYGGQHDAGARAWELMQNPRVVAAIQRERQRYISAELASIAAGTMRDIMQDENAPRAVQFQAAKWCLEQAGHKSDEIDELLSGAKSLNDMTIEELQTFINAGGMALGELQKKRLQVIDITPECAQVSAQPDSVLDVLA